MHKILLIAGLAMLSLAGCKNAALTAAGTVASAAQASSTAISDQATTLTQASRLATLVDQGADTYVTTANPTKGQLTQLQALRAAVRAAFDNLVTANAQGQSLVFASFNSALKAFNSFTAATTATPAAASAAASN